MALDATQKEKLAALLAQEQVGVLVTPGDRWPTANMQAFAETPEMAIVRKHRTISGLIRYDTRRDVEWPQVIKEMIAADKPKLIVMMIGAHDRQPIRERTPAPAPGRANAPAAKQQQSVTAPPPPAR